MKDARKGKARKSQPGLPSREEILRFVEDQKGKVGKRDVARAFGVSGSDRVVLKELLRGLADDGLIEGRRSRIRRPGQLPPVAVLSIDDVDDEGDLVARPVDWDAENGATPRIILTRRSLKRRAGPAPGVGDRVLARLEQVGKGWQGKVIKRLPKRDDAVLAVRHGDRLVPTDRRRQEIPLGSGQLADIADGELVVVRTERAGRSGQLRAELVERVGDVSSEAAISLIALYQHDIPYRFPEAALREAREARPAGLREREDWRDRPFVTIDPADARDHDDAVLAEREGEDVIVVTVAIADVAAYVRPGSAMDREAMKRGNSVYFPGRVVPMLPERISNDLCSLRESEDRPALAVRMRFNRDGKKIDHRFSRVMLRSAASLSYEQAQAAMDGQPDSVTVPLAETVTRPLQDAYERLRRARDSREPLAIEVPERKIVLDEKGGVDRVVVPPRLDAHRLIEEFMIQANVCAAETLESRKADLVYRVHDQPSQEKLEALHDFLRSLELPLARKGTLRPADFNRILERVRDRPQAVLVNEVVLRSQAQAEYAVDNLGHFGLNLRRYAHFTSPIRRYADLLVHRALIDALSLGSDGHDGMTRERLAEIASEISKAERRAMKAERDTVDRLIARHLCDRIGARFDGKIRGVTSAGLFVELDETGADGFVPIATLGRDYFRYEDAHHRLVGDRTGETFRLGDKVEVELVEALPFAGALRFEILSHGDRSRPARPEKTGRARPGRSKRGRR